MFRSCEPPPNLPPLLLRPEESLAPAKGGEGNDSEDAAADDPSSSSSSSAIPAQHVQGKTVHVAVPSALRLKRELKHYRKQVLGIPLQRIHVTGTGKKAVDDNVVVVTVTADAKSMKLRDVLALEANNKKKASAKEDVDVVSVVFCVRRPGCSACRENGQLLSELAAADPRLSVWGIVKETGVDDAGLLDFADHYFRFPIYMDKKWLIYQAMGNRKISLWGLITGIFKSSSRLRKKNIATTLAGEGWIQGGVLIFNNKHQLVYALEENFGNELNIADIKLAIEAAREEAK